MKSRIVLFVLFAVLGIIALQIPVNALAGAKVKFTLFDLFAPVTGAFLGTSVGIAAVFITQVVNIFYHGTQIDRGVIIRLFPTLFAVWYFSLRLRSGSSTSKFENVQSRIILLVPLLAIISFNLNPVGRSVWFYSLFWLVPYVVWPIRERFLIARSLGATMTAHAAGGAIWIWAFNLPTSVWISLIPIVIVERMIFALGISANYVLFNNLGAYLASKKLLPKGFTIDKKYIV